MALYFIWWLSQAASTEVGDVDLEGKFPEYLVAELKDRYGRSGRGRLWVPKDIGISEIPWDDKNPVAIRIGQESCGGVVFHDKEKALVLSMPGFVTDLELNIVTA